MSENNKISIGRRIYKIVLTVSIILSGICLMLGCLLFYLSGNGYSRDAVTTVFLKIDILVYLCLSLIIGDIVWELISPTKAKKTPNKRVDMSASKSNKTETNIIKFTILGLSVTVIVVGFLLGGYSDVLTKAINICTECIGLG